MSGGDASSLLPRQFEVDTPEVKLIVKTLERDDATVRPDSSFVSLSASLRLFRSAETSPGVTSSVVGFVVAGCWLLTQSSRC